MKLLHRLSYIFILFMLVSCGGGSLSKTDNGTTTGSGSDGTSTTTTVSLSISDPNVSAANPAQVTATVLTDGQPVVGEVVTFTTTLGELNPPLGTALTDANGQAVIELTAGTVAGAGTITGKIASGEEGSVSFSTLGDGTEVTNGKVVELSIDSTTVTDASPAIVTATVKNNGVVVQGEVVTFNSTLGVLDPVSGTALTDENGQARITLKAGSEQGAGIVTAVTTSGESNTIGFETAGDSPQVGVVVINITIDNVNVSNASPATLTATVTNGGIAVQGEVVTFSSTIGELTPSSGTVLTDANGQASITLTAGTVEGAGIATAVTSSGEAASIGFSSKGDAAPAGKLVVLSIDNPSVSNATPRTLTATVTEGGVAVQGEIVTFSTTIGELTPASGTVLTDANGQASITLTAGTVEGAGIATAKTSSGEIDSIGFSTTGDGAGGAKSITLAISSQSVANNAPATITATVLDSSGNAVANELVTFTSTLGVLDPSSGTALTNANGQASIILKAGTVKGAGIVTATLSSEESNTINFITEGDGFVANGKTVSIELVDTASLGTTVSRVQARTLKATVTEDGSLVEGEVVTFSTSLGALNPVSGTALTNASGEATITLTAGSIEGAGLATASISSGSTDSVGFYTAGDVVSGVSITLDLTDVNGLSLSPRQINSTNPGKIVATVSGVTEPVLVTFTSDLGSIPIPTAVTNSNNVAIVDIFASDSLGAGTITATLNTGETAQMVFSIGASSLGIGTNAADNNIVPTEANISAGGTTSLPITIWDTSKTPAVAFTDPVEVSFSSTCGSSGDAIIDSPVTTVNGVATATYKAQGCEITDTITATANAGGVVLSASGSVTVSPSSVGSLLFVSATPENISIKGTGAAGTSETSTLIFRLLDSNGNPMENQEVCFDINTTVGGANLTPTPPASSSCAAGTDASNTTDSSGNVQVTVSAGTAATTVRVTASATVSGTTVKSQSSNLVISTGIPDQDSMSLSADILNPEAWSIDGEVVKVTARLADAFNNPVPDGTTIFFTTEGGAIEPSCTTVDGACSVTWTSQNPRPEGKELAVEGQSPSTTNIMGQKYGGRATILATAQGNESFPDLNGNGVFDAAEEAAFLGNNVAGLPYDLAEAFVDYNEDGVYKTNTGSETGGELEPFVDFNQNDSYDSADGQYNGVLCGSATICSTTTSVNVRDSLVLVMSGSAAQFVTTFPAGGADMIINGEGTANASVTIADLHNQPMPKGTTVTFTSTVGNVVSTNPFTWANDNSNRGSSFSVTVQGETTPKEGDLIVSVETPSGVVSTYTVAHIVIN